MARKPMLCAAAAAALVLGSSAARAQAPARAEGTAAAEPQPTRELVWANAEAGLQQIHLRRFDANLDTLSAGFFPTDATGPMLGVGAGFRIVFVTLGARARVGMFSEDVPGRAVSAWQMWTLDAELGIRIPLRRLEPYLVLSGGYASFGGLSHAVAGLQSGLNVHGVDARAGFGVDYYVAKHVTLGALLSADALFLARDGVSVADLATAKTIGTLNEAKARLLQADGSSVGAAWSLTGGLGVHF